MHSDAGELHGHGGGGPSASTPRLHPRLGPRAISRSYASPRSPICPSFRLVRRSSSRFRFQPERRVSDLRRRDSEHAPALDSIAAALVAAKRSKETAEQELRGAESRILLLQDEISKFGSEISSLKEQFLTFFFHDEEDRRRDEFIKKMSGFNKEIRKFYEATRNASSEDTQRVPPSAHDKRSTEGDFSQDDDLEVLKKLENEIALVHNQTHTLELEYLEEQDIYNKVLQEVADLEKPVLLMESIAKQMEELQELAKHPFIYLSNLKYT